MYPPNLNRERTERKKRQMRDSQVRSRHMNNFNQILAKCVCAVCTTTEYDSANTWISFLVLVGAHMPSACLTMAIMMRYGWSVSTCSHAYRWCHSAHRFADDQMKIPIGPQHIGIFGEEQTHRCTSSLSIYMVPWGGHPANDHHVTCKHVESDFVHGDALDWSVCVVCAYRRQRLQIFRIIHFWRSQKKIIFQQNFHGAMNRCMHRIIITKKKIKFTANIQNKPSKIVPFLVLVNFHLRALGRCRLTTDLQWQRTASFAIKWHDSSLTPKVQTWNTFVDTSTRPQSTHTQHNTAHRNSSAHSLFFSVAFYLATLCSHAFHSMLILPMLTFSVDIFFVDCLIQPQVPLIWTELKP